MLYSNTVTLQGMIIFPLKIYKMCLKDMEEASQQNKSKKWLKKLTLSIKIKLVGLNLKKSWNKGKLKII